MQDQEKNTQTDPNIKNFDGHVVDTSKSLLENASRNNLWDNYYDNTQDASTWNGNVIPQNIYVSPDNNKTEDHSSLGPAQPNLDYYNTLSQDVDVVNGQMTDAQKQELAILMLNEINHAREQRGLKPFVMTEQKYQQAQVRASQHSAQVLDHNENDIMTAFGQDQYECLAYIPLNDTHSLYDLLNQASNSLSNMLNADASSDWGHRENFLEDTGTLSANAAFGMHLTDDGQYYVLTFDYDLSNPDSTPNMMDRIAQYQAMGPITGDAHTVDNSAQINDLNNQISNLQNTLASQQSHLNDLTTQLQNLQAQKANVQFDLSQLSSDQQAEYNNAKHTLDTINDWKNGQLANINKDGHVQEAINKLSSAKSNYKSAQEAQAQDETNLQQAKDGLASLNQVLATKQVALDTAEQKANAQANQVVKDKQAKLDAIKSHINDLQNAIATTKATINNAQAQLDKDNQKIADIKNGQKPVDSNKGDDKPTNPTTPTNPDKPNQPDNKPDQPVVPDKPVIKLIDQIKIDRLNDLFGIGTNVSNGANNVIGKVNELYSNLETIMGTDPQKTQISLVMPGNALTRSLRNYVLASFQQLESVVNDVIKVCNANWIVDPQTGDSTPTLNLQRVDQLTTNDVYKKAVNNNWGQIETTLNNLIQYLNQVLKGE